MERYIEKQNIQLEQGEQKAPVQIDRYQLLHDTQENLMLLRLKCFNVTEKTIQSVYFDIDCYDDSKDLIGQMSDLFFSGLHIKSFEEFGKDKPVVVNRLNVASIAVQVKKVVFEDGAVWRLNQPEMNIDAHKLYLISDSPYKEIIQRDLSENGYSGRYMHYSEPSFWVCVCGKKNGAEDLFCENCGHSRKWQEEHFSEEYLLTEQKEMQKKRVESIQTAEKKHLRNNKIIFCVGAVLNLLLLVLCFVQLMGYPFGDADEETNFRYEMVSFVLLAIVSVAGWICFALFNRRKKLIYADCEKINREIFTVKRVNAAIGYVLSLVAGCILFKKISELLVVGILFDLRNYSMAGEISSLIINIAFLAIGLKLYLSHRREMNLAIRVVTAKLFVPCLAFYFLMHMVVVIMRTVEYNAMYLSDFWYMILFFLITIPARHYYSEKVLYVKNPLIKCLSGWTLVAVNGVFFLLNLLDTVVFFKEYGGFEYYEQFYSFLGYIFFAQLFITILGIILGILLIVKTHKANKGMWMIVLYGTSIYVTFNAWRIVILESVNLNASKIVYLLLFILMFTCGVAGWIAFRSILRKRL